MTRNLRRTALALTILLGGCGLTDPDSVATSSAWHGKTPYEHGDLGSLTYRAVDLVLSQAPELSRNMPVVVSSIADTQKLESSTALGNIVADMIRSRLAQDGYTASEFRLRSEVALKNEGEFLLSRNRRALMGSPNAAAIITGTYATSYEQVFVSIKLISATDAHIIGAADFVVPLQDLAGLLRHGNT
jgi:TolB-like protein